MNLAISIELGNDAMQTPRDVADALEKALLRGPSAAHEPLATGDEGIVRDFNGNTVGRWAVVATSGDRDTTLPTRTYDLRGGGFKRTATAAELHDEPDGVLESLANGDLDATEETRHLAQAELDYRRERR